MPIYITDHPNYTGQRDSFYTTVTGEAPEGYISPSKPIFGNKEEAAVVQALQELQSNDTSTKAAPIIQRAYHLPKGVALPFNRDSIQYQMDKLALALDKIPVTKSPSTTNSKSNTATSVNSTKKNPVEKVITKSSLHNPEFDKWYDEHDKMIYTPDDPINKSPITGSLDVFNLQPSNTVLDTDGSKTVLSNELSKLLYQDENNFTTAAPSTDTTVPNSTNTIGLTALGATALAPYVAALFSGSPIKSDNYHPIQRVPGELLTDEEKENERLSSPTKDKVLNDQIMKDPNFVVKDNEGRFIRLNEVEIGKDANNKPLFGLQSSDKKTTYPKAHSNLPIYKISDNIFLAGGEGHLAFIDTNQGTKFTITGETPDKTWVKIPEKELRSLSYFITGTRPDVPLNFNGQTGKVSVNNTEEKALFKTLFGGSGDNISISSTSPESTASSAKPETTSTTSTSEKLTEAAPQPQTQSKVPSNQNLVEKPKENDILVNEVSKDMDSRNLASQQQAETSSSNSSVEAQVKSESSTKKTSNEVLDDLLKPDDGALAKAAEKDVLTNEIATREAASSKVDQKAEQSPRQIEIEPVPEETSNEWSNNRRVKFVLETIIEQGKVPIEKVEKAISIHSEREVKCNGESPVQAATNYISKLKSLSNVRKFLNVLQKVAQSR